MQINKDIENDPNFEISWSQIIESDFLVKYYSDEKLCLKNILSGYSDFLPSSIRNLIFKRLLEIGNQQKAKQILALKELLVDFFLYESHDFLQIFEFIKMKGLVSR